MSGFSAEWLALREPADRRARNRDLLGAMASHFADREVVAIVDLGCGAGSNLRAMAEMLPARQNWRLVDFDPRLLDAARERLVDWVRESEILEDGLALAIGHRHLEIAFTEADLSNGIDLLLDPAPDLVTAAALFDLVSSDWINRFAASLAAHRVPLYTALTYNGVENWSPPHELDGPVLAAFNAHQATDKGFGASAGPRATEHLVRAFEAHGYTVKTAPSPWLLGPEDRSLMNDLAAGIASAAAETGQISAAQAQVWLESRRKASAAEIGHLDLLALPPG